VFGNADAEDGRVGEEHGTEGKGVGTDGGKEDGGNGRVDQTSSGREGVGG
jgi:hypothetical protein